jgi:hypothetical protein
MENHEPGLILPNMNLAEYLQSYGNEVGGAVPMANGNKQ